MGIHKVGKSTVAVSGAISATVSTSGKILADGKKSCNGCGSLLPATAEFFVRNKNMKDGLQNWCRECMREKTRQHRKRNPDYSRKYYAKNKKKIDAKHREYYWENKEKIDAQHRQYFSENREKCLAQSRKHYQENKEQISARHKEYQKNNREKCNAMQRDWCRRNREHYRERQRKWREDNLDRIRRYNEKVWRKYQEERADGTFTPPTQKVCCICKKTYPATSEHFHKNNYTKDGLRYDCKECVSKRRRRDQSQPENYNNK